MTSPKYRYVEAIKKMSLAESHNVHIYICIQNYNN